MAIKTIPSVIIRPNSIWKSLVKEMQEGLIKLKYDVGPDGADGDYGNNTYQAVIKFQKDHSLDADGEFGPQSWTALYEAMGYTVSNPSYPTSSVINCSSSNTNASGQLIENVQVQNFSEGDQVKIKEGATYINGLKVPKWVCNSILYVRNVNSSSSISVSIFRTGLITGNVHPKYLTLIKNAVENVSTTTNISTPGVENNNEICVTCASANNLVKIAKNEVGYHEKATNDNLDNAGANCGANNFTKYARDLAAAGYYNGNKNGYAWCDVFVDWCFYQLCQKNRTEAETMIYQTGDMGAGCEFSANYYKQVGKFDNNPKVGDQIFFYYSGAINHTGIVIEVSGTTVKTVEGNSSDQVATRSYPIGYASIAGYGHPRFSDEIQTDEFPCTVEITAQKLNVRSAGNGTSNVIAILNKGDRVVITQQSGTYGKLADRQGWVDLTYTKKI